MKKYYHNVKACLIKHAEESMITKLLIILVLWLIISIPCLFAFGISSLLGVTPGLTAVIAFGIFLFFAGSTQLVLWMIAIVISLAIIIA